MVMVVAIYSTLSVLSMLTFRSALRPDVMQNVSMMSSPVASWILRIAFAVVIVCHVPYAFFSCKDAFLAIIDEVDRRSVSRMMNT